MSQRKTAEEILKKHLCYGNPHSKQDHLGGSIEQYVFLPNLKGAIQEYTKQEVEARDELIKELIESHQQTAKTISAFLVADKKFDGTDYNPLTVQYQHILHLLTKAQSFNQE